VRSELDAIYETLDEVSDCRVNVYVDKGLEMRVSGYSLLSHLLLLLGSYSRFKQVALLTDT
jgi:hypothetical protein